jgi:hypothetical protein
MPTGKYINTDCKVVVNGVDLSNQAFNVDIPLVKTQVEVSGFSASGAQEFLPGPKDERVTVSFRQNFGGTLVDATLWNLYNSGTPFILAVNPTSGTANASNPTYSGTANLYEYHPINAAFGDVSNTDVTFIFTGGVNRATA